VRRGTGADATASGATRVAGSLNFRDKYAPDFPRVMIREARAGHLTSTPELERLGLVAPPEELPRLPPARAIDAGNRTWPSYAHALDGAPLDSEGQGLDRSRADFVWCMTAATWGFSVDDIAERLLQESAKARANGKSYAATTARNAAPAVERRRAAKTAGVVALALSDCCNGRPNGGTNPAGYGATRLLPRPSAALRASLRACFQLRQPLPGER